MSGPDPTGKPGPAPFTCPRCGAVSHHPDDLRYAYCGACHDFTGVGTEFVYFPGDEAFSERVRDKVRHHHYQNYLQQEQP